MRFASAEDLEQHLYHGVGLSEDNPHVFCQVCVQFPSFKFFGPRHCEALLLWWWARAGADIVLRVPTTHYTCVGRYATHGSWISERWACTKTCCIPRARTATDNST